MIYVMCRCVDVSGQIWVSRSWGMVVEPRGRHKKWPETGKFLRDGIASGRGVHRFWGVLIQKSRSKFRRKVGKLRKIRISGVGVV